LNNTEAGKGTIPGQAAGYTLAELQAFIDEFNKDGHKISRAGNKMQLKQNIEQFLLHYDVMVPLTPPKPPRAPGLPSTPTFASPTKLILPNLSHFGLTVDETTELRDDVQIHIAAKMPHLFSTSYKPTSADQKNIQKLIQERLHALFAIGTPSPPSSPPSPIFPSFNIPTSPTSSPGARPITPPLVTGSGIRSTYPIHRFRLDIF